MSRVREVDHADHARVAALLDSAGMGVPTPEKWRHLWERNPALSAGGPPIARGWVLEEGDRIVGFSLNTAQEFEYEGRPLVSASLGSLAVEPEYRGQSLQLILPFARQGGVDLLLNTTCSPETAKIFPFLKFARLPQADYDLHQYWVLREARFLASGIRKKGYARAVGRVGGLVLSPLLWIEGRARRRRIVAGPGGFRTEVVPVASVGPEFDDLETRCRAWSPILFARRDARALRWHFDPGGRATPPDLVGAFDGDRLVGYAAVVYRENPRLGLKRAYLADLIADRDDPKILRHLLAGAARSARARGASLLESVGFPAPIRAILAESRPRVLRNRAWPYYYKAIDPLIHRDLAEPERWRACLYDGDGSL